MLKKVLLVAFLFSFAQVAKAQHTYYVSSAIGNDTNTSTQAQSKATPWAHAPGMANCASACASYSPVAGDQIILRGGDTWTSSSMPWSWQWSGSNGSLIYIGVDVTWYAGTSFARPIITCSNTCAQQFNANTTSYIQVENLEWTGLFSNANPPAFGSIYSMNFGGSGPGWIADQNYFHGWNVAHDGEQNAFVFDGNNSQNGLTYGTMYQNVFDGSDVCNPNSTCTMVLVYGGAAIVHDNFFGYASNGLVGSGFYRVYNNTVQNIVLSPDNPTDHENGFEDNNSTQLILYNNLVQNFSNQGIVDFQMAPESSKTDYAFNNVLPNMDGGNMEQCYEGNSGGTCYWFNNTAEGGVDSGNPSGNCGRNTGSGQTAYIINQHCITTQTGTAWWSSGGTNHFTTNLPQTKAAANAQGYSFSQTFAFSPTAAGGSTVAAGTNESALCATINAIDTTAGAACLKDTTYGANYNRSTHTITLGGLRTPVTRPTSTPWDIGAFQFSVNTPPPVPSPPVILGTLPSGTVGSAYKASLSASGGTPPYSWSENPTVPGLTLAPSTGILSGTPTASGTYAETFTVTDSTGATGTLSTSLVINSAPPPPPPAATPYTISVSPTSFSVSSAEGASVSPLSISVSDSGPSIATFTLSTTGSWLSVGSVAGSDKNGNTSTINMSTTGLIPGTYTGSIIITMPNQNGDTFTNSPMTIPVSLTISAPAVPVCTSTVSSSTKTSETFKVVISNFPAGAGTVNCPETR